MYVYFGVTELDVEHNLEVKLNNLSDFDKCDTEYHNFITADFKTLNCL